MKKFIIFLAFFVCQAALHSYEYKLSVCAIFCDDDVPYMEEWVKFHRKQGVERFYLYNHGTPGNVGFDSKRIEIIDWQHPYSNVHEWNNIQCSAYMHCIEKCKDKTGWLIVIDSDEFIFSPKGKKLPEVLKDYENFSGVCVNWVCYGTSNYILKKGERITDHLLMRSALNHESTKTVKSIVNPRKVMNCICPHWFIYHVGLSVNENKQYVADAFSPCSINKLRINHYTNRDLNFFTNKKIARGLKWGYPIEKMLDGEKLLNVEFDDCIKKFN